MLRRKEKIKKPRIAEIDFIRGVLIWFVVVDHFFYDFTSWGAMRAIFPAFQADIMYSANFYWGWHVRIITRLMILSIFFLISGISCYFSRNNLKRGIILFGLGGVIDLVFFIGGRFIFNDSGAYVFFGAISCFGLSILVYWFLKFLFDKIYPNHHDDFKWMILCLGMMCIGIGVLFNVFSLNGPAGVYDITWDNFFLVVVGYRQHFGSDWLPLFPYLGFLLVGVFFGEILYKERKSLFTFSLPNEIAFNASTSRKVNYYGVIMPAKGIKRFFTFSGHYSIFFYIIHQPVLILLISIVLLCMGYKIGL